MKRTVTLFIALFCFYNIQAQSEICQVDFPTELRTAAYAHGEQVSIGFEYSTDLAEGVRVFARPFTEGSLTPGYSASGSPIYTGTDYASANFTISSGNVVVDEVRFQILTENQSEVLREFFVPVHYSFSENGVHDFSFSDDAQFASFLLGEQVNINFDYNINTTGGVRIFVRPFTDGNLTPGYGASGSVIYTGTGTQTANFTINSGTNVRVDELRVQVLNPDQTVLLQTFFLPVNWYWSTVKVSGFNHTADNFFDNGSQFTISYNYETTEVDGVAIFPRPVTNGGLTPGYAACGSPTYFGSGNSDCSFTINGSNQRVDHIRFVALNPAQTETLLEVYYPIDLFFGDLKIANLKTCPPSPARLTLGEDVNSYYNYTNDVGENVRIFVRPFTEGNLSPGYGASGSPAYNIGSGQATDFFTLNTAAFVDQLRFNIVSEDQNISFASFFYNVDYEFGDGMFSSVSSPSAADYVTWRLAPNPVKDQGTLYLLSQEAHSCELQLVDILGRTVKQWPVTQLFPQQEWSYKINVQELGLKAGTYFLRLRGPDYFITETLIVQP